MSALQKLLAASLTVTTISAACAQDVTVAAGAVINGVTIVNTRDGSLTPGMGVVIDNGRIVKIASAASVHVSGRAQVIDAAGKYIVPGYLDMHAHVVDGADAKVPPWALLIANGITGFRQMSGSPDLLARGQRLRQDVAAEIVVAPEPLVLVGRLFNTLGEGGRPGITMPTQAVAEVKAQKAAGTDFIKVINVSRDVFYAVMSESKNQGLAGRTSVPLCQRY